MSTRPPSVRLVTRVLEDIGPATRTEIAEHADLPLSTTRWALDRLEELGEIERRPVPGDARKRLIERT